MKTVSLELAKQLKEAGYPQVSTFMWDDNGDLRVGIGQVQRPHFKTAYPNELEIEVNECFASPTADEILDQLPHSINFDYYLEIYKKQPYWMLSYRKYQEQEAIGNIQGPKDNLADAAAKLWLYLKKEGLL